MPSQEYSTRPFSINSGTTRCTVLAGTAKPTPWNWPVSVRMAVLTPITVPWESSSGPPELPGLISASIWMIDGLLNGSCAGSSSWAEGRVRPRALITP